MLRLMFPLLLLLGGCASLDDVVGGIANTPEWFQTRRVEIRGEGYPDFNQVPAQIDPSSVAQRLAQTGGVMQSDVLAFETDPRIAPPNLTEADMAALTLALQTKVTSVSDTPDTLLSDQEIEAMQARLRPPPVNTP